MNADSGADAGHKRRLKNRLMVRRRDPYGLRLAWPESFRASGSSYGQIKYCCGPSGIAAISRSGPDREARIVHAVLASLFLGQIRDHNATCNSLSISHCNRRCAATVAVAWGRAGHGALLPSTEKSRPTIPPWSLVLRPARARLRPTRLLTARVLPPISIAQYRRPLADTADATA
jgi:hypothetical protein